MNTVGHDPLDNTVDDPDAAARSWSSADNDFTTLTEKVSDIVLERQDARGPGTSPSPFTAGLTGILFLMIGYLFITGVGVWGLNNPVGWGWAIVNFVFWVGIGHAGR